MQAGKLDVNSLHRKALSGNDEFREQLFKVLLESFRIIAQHKIWNNEDSEEVVQIALQTIWDKFDETAEIANFQAWSYRVLTNKIGDYYRQQKHRGNWVAGSYRDAEYSRDSDHDPEFIIQLSDCIRKVGETNHRYARVLNLKYQGFSVDEISRKLALKANYLYVVLSRARSMLSDCLKLGDKNDE